MRLHVYSKWLVITGAIIIVMVKFIVRPYMPISPFFQPVVDVLPNLIGSFLMPFGACWFLKKLFIPRTFKDLQTICLLGLILLIINEYLQLIPVFRRTFDYLDILFSFVGILLGYVVFARLLVTAQLRKPASI
jgi:glycopeptide antibiotics resistance protein